MSLETGVKESLHKDIRQGKENRAADSSTGLSGTSTWVMEGDYLLLDTDANSVRSQQGRMLSGRSVTAEKLSRLL